jgi:hypothetical protein
LRVRALADGIVIYSLGPSRLDNGGVVNKQNPNASNIAFQLWNVDARRRPARNPDVGPPQPTQEELDHLQLMKQLPPGMGAGGIQGQPPVAKDK